MTGDLLRGNLLLVAVAIGMILFVDNVDVSALAVALPIIADELHAEADEIQWVMNSYFISSASFFLLAGYIGDRWGLRNTLCAGILLIAVSSLFGGLSDTLAEVVFWRFVQGIGYASTFTMMMMATKNLLPEEKQNIGMGIFMGVATVSTMIGPIVGSALTHHFSWRYIFFINIFLCVPSAWMLFRGLNARSSGLVVNWRELVANVFMFVGLFAATILLMELSQPHDSSMRLDSLLFENARWLSLVVAVLCLGLFALQNRKLPRPVLSKAILHNREFMAVVSLRVVLQALSFSVVFWLPMFLQWGLGYSVIETGFALGAFTASSAVSSILAAYLATWFGRERALVIGHVTLIGGMVNLLWLHPGYALTGLLSSLVLLGAGFAILFTIVNVLFLQSTKHGPEGMLTGVYYTLSYVAGSVGIMITSYLLEWFRTPPGSDPAGALAGAGSYIMAMGAMRWYWLGCILFGIVLYYIMLMRIRSESASAVG